MSTALTFRQLLTFRTVMQLGSVSDAARQLDASINLAP